MQPRNCAVRVGFQALLAQGALVGRQLRWFLCQAGSLSYWRPSLGEPLEVMADKPMRARESSACSFRGHGLPLRDAMKG